MSGAFQMPLPGKDAYKNGKKPLNLVAVNDRTWSTDADLEGAAKKHSAQVHYISLTYILEGFRDARSQ